MIAFLFGDNIERHYISHLHFWHHSECNQISAGAVEKNVALFSSSLCIMITSIMKGEHPKLYSVGTIAIIGRLKNCEFTETSTFHQGLPILHPKKCGIDKSETERNVRHPKLEGSNRATFCTSDFCSISRAPRWAPDPLISRVITPVTHL